MYAITTEANGKTLFIKEYSKRSLDNKHIVEYSENEADALRYERKKAESTIPNIHNPWKREFIITKVSNRTRRVLTAIEDFK